HHSSHHQSSSKSKRTMPAWTPNTEMNECLNCSKPFTFFNRKHHCRSCGKIYCNDCSHNYLPIPEFGYFKPVRVCSFCFELLNAEQKQEKLLKDNLEWMEWTPMGAFQ